MRGKIGFTLMGIILVISVLFVITDKNTNKTFMKDGIMFALTLNGQEITEFPNLPSFYADIQCENGIGEYKRIDGEWKFTVDNIIGNVSCNIKYDSTPDTLRTTITNLLGDNTQVTSGNGIIKNEGEVGIRYEGTKPNNYIWFNNEMWRIIGVVPTCTASGCSTSENLVKIIRDASIGGIVYDAKASDYTGEWGSNTLYTILNSYYYGKSDGTDTEYCYGYQNAVKAECDYRVKGISNNANDFYGSMVCNVYWNTGASNAKARATAYSKEKEKQTVNGKIGLMSLSDYGYGASTDGNAGTNWIYRDGSSWTNTQHSGNTYDAWHTSNGGVFHYYVYYGYAVKPVVYLDSTVYVVSGDGTETTPYQIGK